MINTLTSIEQVERVYDTGCKPILVSCNDFNDYVCKYNTTAGSANLLFREYMSACFLKIWQLQVPEFAFVYLKKHHAPKGIRNIQFDIPCFGSLYNNEYKELDAFNSIISASNKNKYANKVDLLKIILFDYWVSNEDRNHNNYNLMLKIADDKYHFVPIDGNFAFHTGNQNRENYTLSIDETLISSPLTSSLFTSKTFINEPIIENLENSYYICVQNCKNEIAGLIQDVPEMWQIDKAVEYNNLINFLFTDSWIAECWTTFLQHLQVSIISK